MTSYYFDFKKLFQPFCYSCTSGSAPQCYTGMPKAVDVDVNQRLSFVPIPLAHVLRDGKKYLIDAKDIIVSDLVHLDSKVSGIVPADLILYETSEDFKIGSYLESFDASNKHLAYLRKSGSTLPPTATVKVGSMEAPASEQDLCILDAPNFVPMGTRLLSGSGKGICIRIGNDTIQALLR